MEGAMDEQVLLDPAYVVPSVPSAMSGVAWLRANVARFSEGSEHFRRRAIVDALLAPIDPDRLRGPGDPIRKLALALGLPGSVVEDVAITAPCYQPHTEISGAADEAVARLVALAGGDQDEETANRIGLLVQAAVAIDALIAGDDPPVPITRRIAPDGAVVEVSLAAAPFGLGRHACPGRAHAYALADDQSVVDRPTTS
jgi:hypothetical protein